MRQIYIPSGGPPQGPGPDKRIYGSLGDAGLRALLQLLYKNIGESSIRYMFSSDLGAAADRSADFFIQLCGGPPLYAQKHGPPRMRARHIPFEITDEARLIWLDCFFRAMRELPFPEEYEESFSEFLQSFSAWMVNAE